MQNIFKKHKKLIFAVIATCVAAGLGLYVFLGGGTAEWVVRDAGDVYEPTVRCQLKYGFAAQRYILKTMGARLKITSPSETQDGYGRFFPRGILDQFSGEITFEKYGQLLHYGKYDEGQIFIFDNIPSIASYTSVIFVPTGGEFREYKIDRKDAFDTVSEYGFDGKTITLHIKNEIGLSVVKLDLASGDVSTVSVSSEKLGIETYQLYDSRFFYDLERNLFLVIAFDKIDYNKVICYNVSTEETQTIYTEIPVTQIIKADGKYLLTNNRVKGDFIYYVADVEPLGILKIETIKMPDLPPTDIPMDYLNNMLQMEYADGKIYGAVERDGICYYYEVNTGTKEIVSFAKIHVKPYSAQMFKLQNRHSGAMPHPNLK